MQETEIEITIKFKESIFTTIRKRKSIRTYQPVSISPEKKKILQSGMDALGSDLYRFVWFERESRDNLVERLGTYGVIKGAHSFLVGILKKDFENRKYAAVDFGFDFEQLILKAAELSLGTCWIAGTYISALFASYIEIQDNERIAMISPVGIPSGKRHLIAKVATRSANSKSRKSWDELFFDGNLNSPLTKKNADAYALPLEMVRLAPSAVNSQPWRVIKDAKGFHFYASDTKYFSFGKGQFLRHNDMGIALAHFDLACREIGLNGKWIEDYQFGRIDSTLEYIRTWSIENI